MKIIIKDLVASFDKRESNFQLIFRLYKEYKAKPSDLLAEKIRTYFQTMTDKEKARVVWNIRDETEYGLEALIQQDHFFKKYYSSNNPEMRVLKITK